MKHGKRVLVMLVLPLFIVGMVTPCSTVFAEKQHPYNQQQSIRRSPLQTSNSGDEEKRRQMQFVFSTARRLEARRSYLEAYQTYQKLYDEDREKQEYFDGVRRTLLALNRYDEAINHIKARIREYFNRDNMVRLYSQLAEAYYLNENKARADEFWEKAIAERPSISSTYQFVASTMARLRLLDRSIEVFEQGRIHLSSPYMFSVNLATLYQARMDWENAAREYVNALRVSQNRISFIRRGLANFPNEEAANNAVMEVLREEITKEDEKEVWDGFIISLQEILIDYHKKNEDYFSAFQQLVSIPYDSLRMGENLINFAREAYSESYGEIAENALNKAAEYLKDPEGKATVKLGLVEINMSEGRYNIASSTLNDLLNLELPLRIKRYALFKRGMLNLEHLDNPQNAIQDFSDIMRSEKNYLDQIVLYHLSFCYAKTGDLEKAEIELDKIPRAIARGTKSDFAGSYGYDSGDPGYLLSRIALWKMDKEKSLTILDSLLSPPVGSNSENESLLLNFLVSTVSDSANLRLFSSADFAEFTGNIDLAKSLFDSASSCEDSTLAIESLWRKSLLDFETDSTAFEPFSGKYPSHPHSEEVYLIRAGKLISMNQMEDAVLQLEDLLYRYPEGVMSSIARKKLDELHPQIMIENVPEE